MYIHVCDLRRTLASSFLHNWACYLNEEDRAWPNGEGCLHRIKVFCTPDVHSQ